MKAGRIAFRARAFGVGPRSPLDPQRLTSKPRSNALKVLEMIRNASAGSLYQHH